MSLKDFSKLYFALLILHLAVLYRPDSEALLYISKPALLFSLLSYFLHRASQIRPGLKFPFSLALGFSLIGDIVLMFEGETWFLIGMASFAIAHICYIWFYFQLDYQIKARQALLFSIIPVLGIAGLYKFVNTPVELAPFLYAFAGIIGFHLIVSSKILQVEGKYSYLPSLGAFLLIVSDFILAIALFNYESKWLQMLVMLTYGLAQYLIMVGVLHFVVKDAQVHDLRT